MSLRNHLVIVYGALISAIVMLLGIAINHFAALIFSGLVSENIKVVSGHIAASVEDLYNPMLDRFDVPSVEALGMYFVHEGYIVSVEDRDGGVVWDARSCDMEQCVTVIGGIAERMENEYGLRGGFNTVSFPLGYRDRNVGLLSIETYGPYFYSEGEAEFLRTLNRFLVAAGILFVFLSVIVSVYIAAAISRPALKAAEAAKAIAGGNLSVRLDDSRGAGELRELSRSVNEMTFALEKGEQWQKKLSADIAHELRTPLTNLQGGLEAMMDGVFEPTAARLASCHEEVRRLAKLVEDISCLSLLERDTLLLHRGEFDVSKLLASAAEQFSRVAEAKGLAFSLDTPPVPIIINADYDRLMQVFINLISNAVKYTDKGSITVRAVPLSSNGYRCEVSVTDTGIGILPQDLERVFGRFYRTDASRSRGSGGAGIGLSIAQAIVAAHNGKIWAEGGETGTVFRVRV
jgi:signal transduction histidine kinase